MCEESSKCCLSPKTSKQFTSFTNLRNILSEKYCTHILQEDSHGIDDTGRDCLPGFVVDDTHTWDSDHRTAACGANRSRSNLFRRLGLGTRRRASPRTGKTRPSARVSPRSRSALVAHLVQFGGIQVRHDLSAAPRETRH